MKALILAAGYGNRLRPLTRHTPKPLIEVAGQTLLERHVSGLVRAGIRSLVVNVSWLGDQIADYLGDGSRWNVQIRLSREGKEPLETGGGMRHALPLLGPEPFLAVNADILCEFPFETLTGLTPSACHLVLVDNPAHNPLGDFNVVEGRLTNERRWTYSGIGVFHPDLISGRQPGRQFSVVPAIRNAAERGLATGQHYPGRWLDIGTTERLELARHLLTEESEQQP